MIEMFLPPSLSKARSTRPQGAGTSLRDLGTRVGTTNRSWPLPVFLGTDRLTQRRGPTTGDAEASLTHREALVADAAHGEAVVAGVYSPGQHLVQVHVGSLVQQPTPRPAHTRGQQRCSSLLPSGAAATLGRRPRQRRAPEGGGAQLGPTVHPEP